MMDLVFEMMALMQTDRLRSVIRELYILIYQSRGMYINLVLHVLSASRSGMHDPRRLGPLVQQVQKIDEACTKNDEFVSKNDDFLYQK